MKMPKYPNISILKDINGEDDTLNIIIRKLINDFQLYLNLEPIFPNLKIILNNDNISNDVEKGDIFCIGVNRFVEDNNLIIEVYGDYIKFLDFILLREIYNNFIPRDFISYESIQLVINQLILVDLYKHPLKHKWRELIRGHIKQCDQISVGFNRLSEFDRLEKFFKLQGTEKSDNPTQFFFQYVRRNPTLINSKMDNFENLLFEEFTSYMSKLKNSDETVETLRCIIKIFYELKQYRNVLKYRDFFQQFKENGKINTALSLRKFTKNMDWIKKYSYIAPSYLVNYKTINVCLITIFLKFNPIIETAKIYEVIDQFPFFTALKIFRNGFGLELSGYFVIPRVYLEDLRKFIQKMKDHSYLIDSCLLLSNEQTQNVNLNYLREFSQNHLLINPNHRNYKKNFELEFKIDYGKNFYNPKLNILDFVILDRIRFYSTSGFGFERRGDIISTLQNDLLNEIITQRTLIRNLKEILEFFYTSSDLKKEFLQVLEKNTKYGFFYIKITFENYLKILNILDKILTDNPNFKNISEFQRFIERKYKPLLIEENILLNNQKIQKKLFREKLSIPFKLIDNYKKIIEKYKKFHELFNLCYKLKLFDLNALNKILNERILIENIYKAKDKKLKNYYEKYKLYEITGQKIEKIFDKFLNNTPPIIHPILINTIYFNKFERDFIQLVLKETQVSRKTIIKIMNFFWKSLIINTEELISDDNLILVEISTAKLSKKEKQQLLSILFNLFKEDIIFIKSYLWTGRIRALSNRNFYDFDCKEFFYTKDLYKHLLLYVQKIFGAPLETLIEQIDKSKEKFWSNERDILKLINKVNNRNSKQKYDFNLNYLNELLQFHSNLNDYIINKDKFKAVKQNNFFYQYVKSIKFVPAFQYFGLGQYFLYLYPSDMNEIDFKLLFTNTFQKVEYPACIDKSNSLFIKYIIPHGAPQLKYLHWLTKSKKVIREYCGFFIKKVYHILHFSHNLSSEGWVYDKDRFKMHMQNILFKPDYNFQIPEIREYKITDKFISSYFGPDSLEFESLSNIYSWRSIDIKSFLRTKKARTVNHIINLLEKGLIFPYLSLKNLDLHNKVYIIIPNLKPELNTTLVKIFSFFNYAFIYEIEGEYFIYGFEQEKKYQNGLMIKIYFPKCEISEFMRLFDLLFEYLEIKDYLILNDLVDGKNLIKSIYGGLAFLDSYNPLKNLEWNEPDKIWQNPKIFTSKFDPIYPDLISKDKQ